MLHSRKELRRNTEQDRAEGEERKREGREEKGKKERGGREGNGISLFFPLAFSFSLSLGLKRCLIWSMGSCKVDKVFARHQQSVFFLPFFIFPPLCKASFHSFVHLLNSSGFHIIFLIS